MLESVIKSIEYALGVDVETVALWQLALRTLVIYGVGLALVRIGKRRFMGTYSAFDMVLGVTVGALLANAASDAKTLLNAIGLVFGLVVLHWVFAVVTYHWEIVEHILIGKKQTIVEEGELQEEGMRRSSISRSDVEQAARLAGLESLEAVKHAYLERNGTLSIVPYDDDEDKEDQDGPSSDGQTAHDGAGRAPEDGTAPRVVAVDVHKGVQRVIIEVR